MSRGKRTAFWVLSALLAALFALAGATKLAGAQSHIEHFTKWGYPDWLRIVVGLAEGLGAVGLFVRRLRPYAAMGLSIVMGGAVYTHLAHQEWGESTAPLILLGLLLLVGISSWKADSGSASTVAKG